MTTLKQFVAALVLIAIGIGLFYAYQFAVHRGVSAQACTTEAKICPDGSAVGRSGPDCEFAACPSMASSTVTSATSTAATSTTEIKKITRTAKIDQKVSGLNVSITPLEVVDDSRCAEGVQCVWAG